MRKNAFLAASLVLMTLMAACGGGDSTQYVEYGTGDLNGEWLFQSGQPLTNNGNLTFDKGGNLIGVTPPPGSSDIILEFGGQLSVSKPAYVIGLLSITSQVTMQDGSVQTVTDELDFSGNFASSSFISGLVANVAIENAESVPFSLSK